MKPYKPHFSFLRAFVRVIQLSCMILVYFIPVFVCWKLHFKKAHHALVSEFYAGFLRAMNIEVKLRGIPSDYRPLLWVSNHFSYLDVPILGSVLPVRFTPKSEIASWPVIGLFTKMADSVFIDRRVSKTKENQEALIQCFAENGAVSLFPEGTTNDGTALLPFRSSFFSLTEIEVGKQPMKIQNISIAYTHLEDKPITNDQLQYLGWYGDMEFFPHFWAVLRQRGATVELRFHPLINPADFADRKALAAFCQSQVAGAIIKL
jgi:1-acyl-sn-glycerol-3-phosphate acyltransferase